MKLVFLGPPGAGKGTAASAVSETFGVPHISTGDMLRQAIAKGTPTGLTAKAFVDSGALVPSEVIIDMVRERLDEPDCEGGYLLDGFPRTTGQAEALDGIKAPDAVIDLTVPDEFLIKRLTGRRVCPDCKGTFHITRLNDEQTCPTCGGALIQRVDDCEETIAPRLRVYHEQTSPLTAYYAGKGVLKSVDGTGTPDAVLSLILKALGREA